MSALDTIAEGMVALGKAIWKAVKRVPKALLPKPKPRPRVHVPTAAERALERERQREGGRR